MQLVIETIWVAFVKQDGVTDGENATALDYGDILLRDGKVTKEQYDELKKHAENLLREKGMIR